MIRDGFLWLLSVFVVEPVMAEVSGRLGELQAPQAVLQQVQPCAAAAPAALAERAVADPLWGLRTVAGVVDGSTDAQAVIAGATPGCAAAVAAVRPLLGAGAAS